MRTFWSDRIALGTAVIGALLMALAAILFHEKTIAAAVVDHFLSGSTLGLSIIILLCLTCLPVWTLCLSAYMLLHFPTGMEYVALAAVMILVEGIIFFFIGKLIASCGRGIWNLITGSSLRQMKIRLTITVLLVVIAGWLVSMALPFCGIMLFFLNTGYWMDKLPIRAGIAGIPGCRLLTIGGNEDISLEHITAKIQVEGKGLLVVSELEPESFHDVGHLRLHQIDTLKLRADSYGYEGAYESATGKPKKSRGYSEWIDIGAEGPYADKFPFQIRSVQDAIKHFDDIRSILSTWYQNSNTVTVITTNGTAYNASVLQNDSDTKKPK